MFEYVGNMHIHSIYSDGSKNIKQIARDAVRAGLDFIIVTDHNQLTGLQKGEEKYYDSVLVLIGSEVNIEKNHYLALGIRSNIEPDDDHPQRIIDAVNAQGGVGIIAHPDEIGSRYVYRGKTYSWDDWSVEHFQGLEIWNFLSQWRDSITSLIKGLIVLFFPHMAISGPNSKTMMRLDQYQKEGRNVAAFAGSDAHGIKIKLGPIHLVTISAYLFCFRCINMHVVLHEKLSGTVTHDKKLIYDALASGHSWISDDYYQSSRGFEFKITAHHVAYMGDEIIHTEDTAAQVNTPFFARVRLIKDGELFKTSEGTEHIFEHLPRGIYRVEADLRVRFRFRPWIYTNSIRVT